MVKLSTVAQAYTEMQKILTPTQYQQLEENIRYRMNQP